jgi:hypothetical protein
MMCAVIPPYFFNFFTFHLKLFSKRLWIRRAIAITFNGIVILATSYLFGYLRFEINSLINYGITILVFIVLTVFIYYVEDKIEQQNLKLINQKLSEKNTSNIE